MTASCYYLGPQKAKATCQIERQEKMCNLPGKKNDTSGYKVQGTKMMNLVTWEMAQSVR